VRRSAARFRTSVVPRLNMWQMTSRIRRNSLIVFQPTGREKCVTDTIVTLQNTNVVFTEVYDIARKRIDVVDDTCRIHVFDRLLQHWIRLSNIVELICHVPRHDYLFFVYDSPSVAALIRALVGRLHDSRFRIRKVSLHFFCRYHVFRSDLRWAFSATSRAFASAAALS